MMEPRSDDAEMVSARRASTEHRAAYNAADAFESRLEQALDLPTDPDLRDHILARCTGAAPRTGLRWLAVAATLVIASGLGVLGWWNHQRSLPVRTAFVEHFYHPEPAALQSTRIVSLERLQGAFADHGEDLAALTDSVTYLSRCRIGGRGGLHLVAREEGQQITIMYLPEVSLPNSQDFHLEGITARLVPTRAGALAFFGHQGQDVVDASQRWLDSLEPQVVAAL